MPTIITATMSLVIGFIAGAFLMALSELEQEKKRKGK